MNAKRASILIIALWSVCFLSTLAVILGIEVRQKITLLKRIEERERLHFLLEAGLKKASSEIKGLAADKSVYALMDTWSSNESSFKDISTGDGRFDVFYESAAEDSEKPRVIYGLQDEESKININRSDSKTIQRLLSVMGMDDTQAQELAFSILDWRDKDSELSMPIGSAEDSYYRNLSLPYEAKDGDFEVFEELLLVKGMNKEILESLRGYITIYGNGKVNVNTASKAVLVAIGLNEDVADKLITFRNGKDELPQTQDDNTFENPAEVFSKISQSNTLTEAEQMQLNSLAEKTTVKSENFSVRVLARLDNSKTTGYASGVIDSEGKTVYWNEL